MCSIQIKTLLVVTASSPKLPSNSLVLSCIGVVFFSTVHRSPSPPLHIAIAPYMDMLLPHCITTSGRELRLQPTLQVMLNHIVLKCLMVNFTCQAAVVLKPPRLRSVALALPWKISKAIDDILGIAERLHYRPRSCCNSPRIPLSYTQLPISLMYYGPASFERNNS